MVFSSITFLFYFLPIFLAALFPDAHDPGQEYRHASVLPGVLRLGRASVRHHPSALDRLQFRAALAHRRARGIVPPVGARPRGRRKPAATRNFQIRQFHHRQSDRRFSIRSGRGHSRPTLRFRSASRFSPSTACRTSSTSTADGLRPIAIRSTSLSTFPCSRNSSRDRSFATRPSRGNWTPAGSRFGRASVGARIFIIGLAQKVLVADVVAPLVQVAFDQVPIALWPRRGSG